MLHWRPTSATPVGFNFSNWKKKSDPTQNEKTHTFLSFVKFQISLCGVPPDKTS